MIRLEDEKCGQDETYMPSVVVALNGMAWRLSWLTARPARRHFETALPIDRDVVVLHGETRGAVPVLHRWWSSSLSSVGGEIIVVRCRADALRVWAGGLDYTQRTGMTAMSSNTHEACHQEKR